MWIDNCCRIAHHVNEDVGGLEVTVQNVFSVAVHNATQHLKHDGLVKSRRSGREGEALGWKRNCAKQAPSTKHQTPSKGTMCTLVPL